jgi:single-strand DNA-binding protein
MSNTFSAVLRIGKDAVTRQAGKTTVTGFSGACNVGFGDNQTTLWFNCSIWGDRGAKLEQYLIKGSQVWVSGELSQREYEGKQYLELRVDQLDLVGKKSDSPAPQTQHHEQKSNGYVQGVDDFDDSIDF